MVLIKAIQSGTLYIEDHYSLTRILWNSVKIIQDCDNINTDDR